MATVNEVYKVALENRNAINTIKDLAKATEDFTSAGTLLDTDVVRVSRSGASLKSTVGDIKAASGGGDLNVRSDWNETVSGNDSFILNKPENLSDFNNDLPPVDVSADAYSPLDTGVITGGQVTINSGNNTLVDIAAGTGIIMDWSNPAAPIRHMVSWNAFIGEAMPNISAPFTNFYISTVGQLIKVSGILSTPDVRRSRIQLQTAEHANGFFISNVTGSSRPAYQVVDALLDYVAFAGELSNGNQFLNVGANLEIQKFVGETCFPFINRINNPLNPTILSNPAIPTVTFQYIYRNGVGGFSIGAPTTDINPDIWDNGSGTPAAITGGDFTNQRIYHIPSVGATFITLGQARYNDLAEAKASIFTEDPDLSPLVGQAILTTVLVVQDNASDLSNPLDAEFVDVEILGRSGGSGGGGGAGDMTKAAYDTLNTGNSVDLAQSLNGFDETDFVFKTEFRFDVELRVSKKPSNVAAALEIGDIVSGYWNATLYLKQAVYNGGDSSLIGSYTIIDSIEF